MHDNEPSCVNTTTRSFGHRIEMPEGVGDPAFTKLRSNAQVQSCSNGLSGRSRQTQKFEVALYGQVVKRKKGSLGGLICIHLCSLGFIWIHLNMDN